MTQTSTLSGTRRAALKLFCGSALVTLLAAPSSAQNDRKVLPIVTNDAVYVRDVDALYVTRPDNVENGNSICVLDAYKNEQKRCIEVGIGANQLALTKDGKYLWIGLDGASQVVRYNIATENVDVRVDLTADERDENKKARAIDLIAHPTDNEQFVIVQGAAGNAQATDGTVELYNTNGHLATAASYAAPVRQVLYNESTGRLLGFAPKVDAEVQEYTLAGDALTFEKTFNLPGDQRTRAAYGTAGAALYHPDGSRYSLDGEEIAFTRQYDVAQGRITHVLVESDDRVYYLEEVAADNEVGRVAELLTFNTGDTAVVRRQEVGPLFYASTGLFSFGEDVNNLGIGILNFGAVTLLRDCVSEITEGPVLGQTSQLSCDGSPIQLSGPEGENTYYWSNGSRARTTLITETGRYTLAVADDNGCLSPTSDTLVIAIERTPTAPEVDAFGGERATLCVDGEVGLRALTPAPNTIEWSNGELGEVTRNTEPGTYTAVAKSPSGCTSPVSKTLTVEPGNGAAPATPTITVPNQGAICSDNSVQLMASTEGATKYRWSNGGTTQQIDVFKLGAYAVQAIDAQGCGSAFSEAFEVKRGEQPDAPKIEQDDAGRLTTDKTGKHRWFRDGDEFIEHTEATFTGEILPGIYTARVVTNGCSSDLSEAYVVELVGTRNVPEDAKLRVYPNPVSNTLFVESSARGANLELYSATGQLVRSHRAGGTRSELQVADLPAGFYALRVRSQNGEFNTVRRVLVTR